MKTLYKIPIYIVLFPIGLVLQLLCIAYVITFNYEQSNTLSSRLQYSASADGLMADDYVKRCSIIRVNVKTQPIVESCWKFHFTRIEEIIFDSLIECPKLSEYIAAYPLVGDEIVIDSVLIHFPSCLQDKDTSNHPKYSEDDYQQDYTAFSQVKKTRHTPYDPNVNYIYVSKESDMAKCYFMQDREHFMLDNPYYTSCILNYIGGISEIYEMLSEKR